MADSGRKIIIVTGPESTGKTSIATHLAKKFDGNFIAEYARNYIAELNRKYNYDDILHIAENQQKEIEKVFNTKDNSFWMIDTHLIVTKVWFIWHAGRYPEWINKAIEQTMNCLYLLCAPDIEWQADNVRENGGVKRIELFEAYKQELKNYDLPFRIVTGENDERFRNAVNFVEDYWG